MPRRPVTPPLPPPKTISLAWDVLDANPATVSELWSSPDFASWTLRATVPRTGPVSTITLPATNHAEFFKVRNRLGDEVSDWSRK